VSGQNGIAQAIASHSIDDNKILTTESGNTEVSHKKKKKKNKK
jgi:hypothetical protein